MARIIPQPRWVRTLAPLPVQVAVVAVLAFALYANTLGHQYALDDGVVITDNAYTTQGIKGIPDILSHDTFFGAVGNTANLPGGRYRPLSLVMFATEISLFGAGPFTHHLGNVLWYAAVCVLLLLLLRRFLFSAAPLTAFAATLLFTVHPIHTEVVANIKGRDELLSLFFLLLSLYHLLFRVQHAPDAPWYRWVAWRPLLWFALALLSKENGVIFVGLVPLTLYFFAGQDVKRSALAALPFVLIVGGYFLLRSAVVNVPTKELTEVMDAPYLLATQSEHIGSICFTLLLYLRLLLWPHPLSFDYGYAQIPYRSLSDPGVWAAIAVLLAMIVLAVRGLLRKDLLAWCILFFLATLSLVANVFVNVGAPLAERFLFQASVPFVVAVAELIRRVVMREGEVRSPARAAAVATLIGVLALGTVGTVDRNTDWRTGDDLFLHDVHVVPNSARANTYAGTAEIRRTDAMKDPKERRAALKRALAYLRRSEEIKKDYILAHLNMGVALIRLDSLEAAEAAWERARAIDPNDAKLRDYDAYVYGVHFKRGMELGTAGKYPLAVQELRTAVKYGPAKAEAWYNLGGAYFSLKDTAQAKACWERTLQLDPAVQQAKNALASLGPRWR